MSSSSVGWNLKPGGKLDCGDAMGIEEEEEEGRRERGLEFLG